jgi:hypothetical protein
VINNFALRGSAILWLGKYYATYFEPEHAVHKRRRVPGRVRRQINKLFETQPKYVTAARQSRLTDTLTDTMNGEPEPQEQEAPETEPQPSNEPPKQDPSLGDKTPAYVAWFKANKTAEEFQAKYGSRKIAKTPEQEKAEAEAKEKEEAEATEESKPVSD